MTANLVEVPEADAGMQALCLSTAVGKPIAGGEVSPRGVAISVRSSSEGSPRERVWLEGHQGVCRGRKASRHMVSARTQHDPGRQSPGAVNLDGWVALWGCKTS
jgi:hypothetical protein